MHMPHLLAIKRDGGVWSKAEIQWFVEHLDDLPREQVGAWLMAAQLIGLNEQETLALTDAMLSQGVKLPTREGAVDKHSTGGVGDKMSIVLAPALHASGATVPMLAGRGLAHTGGTIDKLEAIPGFNTGLHMEEMATNPCFIARQTADIAPADAVLYAVRDVTATVPCIGLITASILSKKAAEGIERLVLDVKVGRAAFMQNRQDAHALAVSMVNVGTQLGLDVTAQLTEMDRPIGRMYGNSHEIAECIDCLKGEGPDDTMALVHAQAAALGVSIGEAIASGQALNAFKSMLTRQGVDPSTVERLIADPWSVLPRAPQRYAVTATADGYLADLDALTIGEVLCEAGAGRSKPGAEVDHGIGIQRVVEMGGRVTAGQTVLVLDGPDALDGRLLDRLHEAITVANEPPSHPPRLLETIAAYGD